jgi:hypothetical protein
MKKHTSGVTARYSRNTRHSRTRMVLTVSSALSLVTGLVCHHRPRKISSANLTPASGRRDHTTSPSANSRARRSHESRPPHPVPNVRDDRDTPLQGERDGCGYGGDLGKARTEIFLEMRLDGPNHIEPVQQIRRYAQGGKEGYELTPSLRAERSNPSRHERGMDCFVASLLAMTWWLAYPE